MVTNVLQRVGRWPIAGRALVLVALLAGALFLGRPAPAEAHCDSINGPVVEAAKKSLDTKNPKYVLAYVPAEAESELRTAFTHTLSVRKLGGEARALADVYFYETAVRLHREGEGAAYTGLNYETDHGPALEAADQALTTGSLESAHTVLAEALEAGLAEQYEAVVEARKTAKQLGTLEADRERAEAELMFEKYVFDLYSLAAGDTAAAEGQPASHQH